MRISEFIFENKNLDQIRHEIITGVNSIDNPDLLEKIRAALYSEDLNNKLHNAFSDESTTVHRHIDRIVHTIASLSGLDIKGKLEFAKGLKHGYISIDEMLSGKRVSFSNLIKAPHNLHKFALDFFNELIAYQPNSKGPGEFALAVMSPRISIDGSGDLKVGNHIIEVKASTSSGGGSMGEANLSYEDIPSIFEKYGITLGKGVGKTASLSNLVKFIQTDGVSSLQDFAEEFWRSIFKKYPKVSMDELVNATLSKDRTQIDHAFIKAAYLAYRGTDTKKFDLLMLLNKKIQELQCFDDENELVKHIAAVDAEFLGDKVARSIVPRVKLAKQKKSTDVPSPPIEPQSTPQKPQVQSPTQQKPQVQDPTQQATDQDASTDEIKRIKRLSGVRS